MAGISLRHIEIFHAVITTGNLTEAAALLHTSQPTVSRELARFEKLTGLQLFEYGLDRIVSAAEGLRQFRQGELSLACLPVFSQSLLPLLCQPFMQRYPDLSLNIIPQESPLLEEWLSAQRYDLGLTETTHTPAGTERSALFTADEVCVLPADHPLAQRAVLSPADFNGQNYISLSRTDSYRQILDGIFAEHGVQRRMVMETHSAASVCSMVKAGIGVSIVNPLTALDYADSGVTIRRFSIAVPFTVSLIRPRHRPASALVDAFSQHLHQHIGLFSERLAQRLS